MTAINSVTDLTLEGDIAVVTLNSPPVNAMSAVVRQGLFDGMKAALENSQAKAIVLVCEGKTFIAGADIAEFSRPPVPPSFAELYARIDDSTKPVIAAVHGTALGGGTETTLYCHFRIAVPSAKFGLPEVTLGILPGGGGTQRLPRLIGVAKALEMIATGQPISAREAFELGLVDELAPEGQLRKAALVFARRIVAENRPLIRVSNRNDKVLSARGQPEIFNDFRRTNARKFRGFKAPEYNIRCVEAAIQLPYDAGMKLEGELFGELVTGTQSAAQRYAFFAERKIWKIPDVSDTTPTAPIHKVGIVGAGTMGGGIAMNFANAGIAVTIVESQQAALDRGIGLILKNYETSAKRGRIKTDDVFARMRLIQGTLELSDLSDCDLIIEAVYEDIGLKKQIFSQLDRIAKSGAILATNTSGLDIDDIASVTKRPEMVIGLHFFSPANVMRLLEVVRADKTSKSVIATAMQTARKIGKVAVLVGVCPGFVGNRMVRLIMDQTQKLIMEGAMPWDVDRAMYNFGMAMGPFAVGDLAGLDIGWSRETSKGATLREILCEMDRRGQKTSAGYYDYDENRTAKPSPVVEKIIRTLVEKSGITPRQISDEEIVERCTYPIINEGAKILEEGKAIRASDIDVIYLNGYGWPVYRGGPMFYADTVGLDRIVSRLREYIPRIAPEMTISPLLMRLARDGKRFQDS